MTGARLATGQGLDLAVTDLVRRALEAGAADCALMPVEEPAGGGFAYVLIRDAELLERARALPPVMPVQGARALGGLGDSAAGSKVLAVMRPCEARAAVELAKLEQVRPESVTVLTADCPGALPLATGLAEGGDLPAWTDNSGARPVCRVCDQFSSGGDLHVATLGGKDGEALLVPLSEKGSALLEALGMAADADASAWEQEAGKLTAARREARAQAHEKLAAEATGLEKLVSFFAGCIGCHNCRSACPICYCRRCYIDGETRDVPAADHLGRARESGALRLLPDTVLFHIGRMAHMSLSCVSCGACEDACPADIPVAQLFSMVSARTQALFEYRPGSDPEGAVPLATFVESELHDFED
jgi:formate dehydrogenase subunit beta